MSDFDFNDDFGRAPGQRMDPDQAMEAMRHDFENTPEEKHHADEAAAREYRESEVGKALTDPNSTAAYLVENDALHKHIRDSDPTKTASEVIAESTQKAIDDLTSSSPDNIPSGATAASGPSGMPAVDKPTSLESSVASIMMSGQRQERFIISGDPKIEQRFYEKLAAQGLVTYRGGSPVICTTRAIALSMLKEAAAEVPGAQFHHALSLKLDREGGSGWAGFKADIANKLHINRHQVDVVVVGNQETVDSKMKELGSLMKKMDDAKFFGEPTTGLGDKTQASAGTKSINIDGEGRLVPPADGPVTLKASKQLYDLTSMARDVVIDYTTKENADAAVRKEFKNAEEDKKIASKKGDPDIASGATSTGTTKVKVNEHTQKLAAELDKAIGTPDTLRAINEKGQSGAMSLLSRARGIQDPAKPELATLPDVERQTAIVQLASLVAKVDSGEFTNKSGKPLSAKDVDATRGGESSIRDKVDGFIAAEKARDPQFLEKAAELTKEMVKSGVLTEKQAESVTVNLTNSKSATTTTEASIAVTTPVDAKPAEATPTAEPKAASTELRDKIETLAKAGPESLTKEQATGLVAELDATRTKPLSALDANSGDKPTQTLVRTEALLQEMAGGRLGPELQAQAQDLQTALGKWNEQNADRVVKTEGGSPEQLKADFERFGKELQTNASVNTAESANAKPSQAPQSGSATTDSGVTNSSSSQATQGASHTASSGSQSSLTTSDTKQAGEDISRADAGATSSSSQSGAMLPSTGGHTSPAEKLETQLSASQQSSSGGTQEATQASQSSLRMGETEAAAGKLSVMMANPAGAFTNRDKSWNEANVVKAASEVTRLDTESVASMSPAARTKLAAYSVFLAEGANSGRLPGFTSEQGQQLAANVTEKATALVNGMKPGDGLSAGTQKELEKAERMVGAMEQRQQSAGSSMTSQNGAGVSSSMSSAKEHANANFAKDLAHAVYKQPELSEATAKYLLKNSSHVTSDSLKSLDPQTRAQAVVAMGHLASEVRGGAMGDFSKLNSTVQKNVIAAQNNSGKLQAEMSQDPAMRTELQKAHMDLPGKASASNSTSASSSATHGDSAAASKSSSSGASKSTANEAAEPASAATKPAGRSMDR